MLKHILKDITTTVSKLPRDCIGTGINTFPWEKGSKITDMVKGDFVNEHLLISTFFIEVYCLMRDEWILIFGLEKSNFNNTCMQH